VVTPLGRLLACVTAIVGIMNLAFMINLIGSCFDEAYTRFLSREEQDFKKRLESEWDETAEGRKIRLLSNILEGSGEGSDEDLMYSLATYVAELNFWLVQMQETPESFRNTASRSKLKEIMANTRASLEAQLRNQVEP